MTFLLITLGLCDPLLHMSFYKCVRKIKWKWTLLYYVLFEYLIDKDYNFSRFRCLFLLVQVILGNVNSHSGFPTPCREAYNDIFPLQGWLGDFHLVRPEMQFWLRRCSFCHILFVWRKLKGRKIRERAIK